MIARILKMQVTCTIANSPEWQKNGILKYDKNKDLRGRVMEICACISIYHQF